MMNKEELIGKVRELKEFKQMSDELAAEITSIEDELKAEMVAQDAEEMTVDVFKLRYKTVVSSRIDTTSLKRELPKVAERYTKQIKSRRFTIS